MKIDVTTHALERLNERAYLQYFRSFTAGEDQAKWLHRQALAAIKQGVLSWESTARNPVYWYKRYLYIFEQKETRLVLLTLYKRKNKPKALQETL